MVLGYILAGLLVGPEISFLPTVQEKESIKVWAEIGVIVLLFGLGLEVNFKKLAAVGVSATITALIEVFAMLALGYGIGSMFGWNSMDSLFLGGMLAISSTTIIIKAIEELGFKQKKFVDLVFGVLIVEDLFAILILVLLSTLAVSNNLQGTQLLYSTAKLIFFLSLWFVGGIFLIPWLLRKIRSFMNPETCLIVSLALCLLMVLLASATGFSPALGAFVMGSILAETPEGSKIEENIKQVKDLFAAIFFVSVGMLIDLDMLRTHFFAIIIISIFTVIGKSLSASFGAILSGQNLKNSLQTGMGLAQIGEFSFIIATLGLSLKVTSDFLYPIVVAVSVITTFTTPYLIRHSENTSNWIESKLPPSWRRRVARNYSETPNFKPLTHFKESFTKIFLNTIIIVAITLACTHYLSPILSKGSTLFIAIFLSLPFLWALILRTDHHKQKLISLEELKQLSWRASLSLMARILYAICMLSYIISEFTSALTSFALAAVLSTLLAILGLKNFTRIYALLEARFLRNLNEKEKLHLKRKVTPLASFNAHLSEIDLHPNSEFAGRSIGELAIRKTYGLTIVMIKRGSKKLLTPSPDTLLMPHDKITFIGSDEQIMNCYKKLQEQVPSQGEEIPEQAELSFSSYVVSEESPFLNKTIFECSKDLGLVLSIEKSNGRITGPDPKLVLELSDRLWIAKP